MEFEVEMSREPENKGIKIQVDGVWLSEPVIKNIEPGKKYAVKVIIGL